MSTVEKVDKNVVSFEFAVSADEFEKGIEKAYRKNVGKINIQGFRKGKAPRKIIEKYYGPEIFYEDAINIVLPDAYDKAIEENNIFPVDQPEIDIKGEISKDNGITFTAKVTVKPEFELGQYKGIKASKVSHRTLKKDIDAEIEKMRERNSRMVSVEDRPVQKDDIANIDFEGFCDGVAFKGGKGENYDLTIGSGQFIPGFEDQLIGKNIGDEVDVKVTFPKAKRLKLIIEEHGIETFGDEPLKITIKPKSFGYTGIEIAKLLMSNGIYPEFYDPDFVVLMLSPQNSKADLNKAGNTLCSLTQREGIKTTPPPVPKPKHILSPRDVIFRETEVIPIDECLGRVCALSVISCPPAIPLAVCGEVIDSSVIESLRYYGITKCTVCKGI